MYSHFWYMPSKLTRIHFPLLFLPDAEARTNLAPSQSLRFRLAAFLQPRLLLRQLHVRQPGANNRSAKDSLAGLQLLESQRATATGEFPPKINFRTTFQLTNALCYQPPQTTIKVYTNCLKIDIEYKTLGIQWDTTSKEVISQLLRR